MDAIRSRRQPGFRRDGQDFHWHGWTLVDAATERQQHEPALEILEDIEPGDPRLYPHSVLNAVEFGFEPADVAPSSAIAVTVNIADMDAIRTELAAIQKTAEEQRESIKSHTAELAKERKAHKEAIKTLEGEIAALQAENERLKAQIAEQTTPQSAAVADETK